MIPKTIRGQVETSWGAAAHSKAVNKAIGRHRQAAKDEARALALSEVIALFDAHDASEERA